MAVVTFTVRNSEAAVIILNDVNPGGSNPVALAAFATAANLWTSKLIDPVTIRVDVSFEALGQNILGSADSFSLAKSYSDIRAALAADATSLDDAAAVASLPGSSLQFRTNAVNGSVVLDANGSNNNVFLDVNRANLKALGLLNDDLMRDAVIKFSNLFTFDFDPSNGITAGAIDFVGVAAHEIGHALGFVSGVDAVDYYTGNGPGRNLNVDLNRYAVHSVLDLYRYSTASLSLGGAGTRDFATGGTSYFSLNGGATNLGTFSTGAYNGDGRQASHWKDNLGLGIMDPTFSYGELGVITNLDVRAFDVIGWNLASQAVVPEPASALLLALGGFGLVAFRRRNRESAVA